MLWSECDGQCLYEHQWLLKFELLPMLGTGLSVLVCWYAFVLLLQIYYKAYPPEARSILDKVIIIGHPIRIVRIYRVLWSQLALVQYWKIYLHWNSLYKNPRDVRITKVFYLDLIRALFFLFA